MHLPLKFGPILPIAAACVLPLSLFPSQIYAQAGQIDESVESGASGAISSALCGEHDNPEPGIQGLVPAGQEPSYNCGLELVGQLPVSGNVAATGTCAYVRLRGNSGTPNDSLVHVIDVSDPANPQIIGDPLPVYMSSETMRTRTTDDRAIMVSGSSVFDISDCLHPQRLGEIDWPDTSVPGVARRNLPHDIRINRAADRVYSSFGLWEVDLSDLADPASWRITDRRCEIAAQIPGPWQEMHRQANAAGRSLCDDATRATPMGANYAMGGSPLQASLIWPQVSHALDVNEDDTRIYVGDQAGGNGALWAPEPKMRILDLTQEPVAIIGEAEGPGHGLDWFRAGGREYVLHSNEHGSSASSNAGDTCMPYPRPTALNWGFEVIVTDVTEPASADNVAMLTLAINDPEFCDVREDSGRDPWIAHHMVDDPLDAHFAAINFGDAGFRIFDIRDPRMPVEVAYFNHGVPVHAGVGHYDAERRLIYFSDEGGFKVLRFEEQVVDHLGL